MVKAIVTIVHSIAEIQKMNKPLLLIILDGFGYRKEKKYNAIAHASTPNLDHWFKEYPHTLLTAHGSAVGLPEGSIGNSEVGHLTIGAGRVIKKEALIINEAIESKALFSNKALIKTLNLLKKRNGTLHIIGLLSNAGVHALLSHLYAYSAIALQEGISDIVLHLFLDGRDSAPQSAASLLEALTEKLNKRPVRIASLMGRFYAMDRDHNWDRTQKAYIALTKPQARRFSSWQKALDYYYAKNITDEYIPPLQLDSFKPITAHDDVLFINFRPDRARQLAHALADPTFKEFNTPIKTHTLITPINYETSIPALVLFDTKPVHPTLKEVISNAGKSLFTIAETEKYAHVTYFFDGGIEKVFPNETRILIPSKKEVSYADNPEMSAKEITDTVLRSLKKNPKDFYLINYANADMVGHTGNFGATIKAIEFLDRQLGRLYRYAIEKLDGTMIITADHGNAEDMFDENAHQPRTSHTTHPVPFLVIKKAYKNAVQPIYIDQISKIASFVLHKLNLNIPPEMK